MYISRLAKAAIFGLCYYLILNVYLYYALAFKDVHTGILANKIISTLVYGFGFIITLPFVYLSWKYEITRLGNISLILNAVFWSIVFYCILLLMARKKKA